MCAMLVLVGHPKKGSDSTSSGTLPAGPEGAGARPEVHTRLHLFLHVSYFFILCPTFSYFFTGSYFLFQYEDWRGKSETKADAKSCRS